MSDDITLEIYKLIIPQEEIEAETDGNVSEYLIRRAAFYGNRLGKNHKLVKEFDIVKDPMSGGWILVFMCERWF